MLSLALAGLVMNELNFRSDCAAMVSEIELDHWYRH
jgi:hypothetical protein